MRWRICRSSNRAAGRSRIHGAASRIAISACWCDCHVEVVPRQQGSPSCAPPPFEGRAIAYGSLLGGGNARAACSTSPRVRGEVDLRAEPWRSEANRVRGLVHKLRLAVRPLTRILSLRSESHLSPHAGRGGASGFASHLKIPGGGGVCGTLEAKARQLPGLNTGNDPA